MAAINRGKSKVKLREGSEQPSKKDYVITGTPPAAVRSIKGILFGPPKTGKTTAACSGKNVLLINFDPEGYTTETIADRTDITVVVPEDWNEVKQIVQALHGVNKGQWDWVVFDSLSFAFQLAGGPEILATYDKGGDVRRPYGKAGARVSQVVNDLAHLTETNVIFTAHLEKVDTGDEGVTLDTSLGETEVKLAVTPMVWKTVGPAVSFIGRTQRSTVWEKAKDGTRNKRTVFTVSLNDGERSPAGSRLPMDAEYEITSTTLDELATKLIT